MFYNLIAYLVMLAVSFYLITKSADYFVDEAATVGRRFGMSAIVIGLTIVAVGTSLPEIFTTLVSILFTNNYSDFIIGTIMGSNISNTLLVFGVFLIFAGKFQIKKDEKLNVSVLLLVTVIFLSFVIIGYVNHFAIFLVIIYVLYIIYLARYRTREVIAKEKELVDFKHESLTKSGLILFGSLVGLIIGTKLVITSIENIGAILEIPIAYLTLTVIAAATSFPEVAVSYAAAKKKEYLLGIGNVLGSNIINIALIFGISGFFGFYSVATSSYVYSIIFLIFATTLFSILLLGKRFIGVIGWILVILYFLYLVTFFL